MHVGAEVDLSLTVKETTPEGFSGMAWSMCWRTVRGSYEKGFFWAKASMWGSVYLKQSQLQALCSAEIRKEEEVFPQPTLPVVRVYRARRT